MTRLTHFVSGEPLASAGTAVLIVNPATGREVGLVPMGLAAEADTAIAAAKAAFPTWSALGLQHRINLLFDLRQCLSQQKDQIIDLVITETGKTLTDATLEVARALDAIGHATATTVLSATPFTRGVAGDVNTHEVRYPVGVVGAISPFNFPVLIPMLQSMMALACGNTVVAKPSERNPSSLVRIAELFCAAGLPKGVFNVLLGSRVCVERIIEHPDVAAITFVGSSSVARQVRQRGVQHNKRVQAFGGGKNHLVVMPDTDIELAANAAISSAFGAAGQRCMAVSVVVAVGAIADALVTAIATRAAALPIGNVHAPGPQLGPVISESSRARISQFVQGATLEGAQVVLDGRQSRTPEDGWYVGPTLIDHVRPGMAVHSEEIFGPVLCVVRVNTYEEAIAVISASNLGNGAAIFTRDLSVATRFTDDAPAGQIGINVPIPSPVYFHGFAGWKDSAFTETKMHGRDTIDFLTRTKTVTARMI